MMKHKIHKWLCQEQEKNSKQRNKNNSGLYPGYKTTTGFTLMREITTLDQFWRAINTEKSIFARHRMYPTAFFFSWQIKTIKEWIDAGRFYIATREEGNNKKTVERIKEMRP